MTIQVTEEQLNDIVKLNKLKKITQILLKKPLKNL